MFERRNTCNSNCCTRDNKRKLYMCGKRRVIGLALVAFGSGIIFSMFIDTPFIQSITGLVLIIIGYFLMKCW